MSNGYGSCKGDQLIPFTVRKKLCKHLWIRIHLPRSVSVQFICLLLELLQCLENLSPGKRLPLPQSIPSSRIRIFIPKIFWIIIRIDSSDEKLSETYQQ